MRFIGLFALLGLLFAPNISFAGDTKAGGEKFAQLCASCHGQTGKGDGPAGGSLNPKPKDLSDAAWQAKVTDEHLKKVILEGGPAVGLSPMMPPWGHSLKGADIDNVVAFIRSLKK